MLHLWRNQGKCYIISHMTNNYDWDMGKEGSNPVMIVLTGSYVSFRKSFISVGFFINKMGGSCMWTDISLYMMTCKDWVICTRSLTRELFSKVSTWQTITNYDSKQMTRWVFLQFQKCQLSGHMHVVKQVQRKICMPNPDHRSLLTYYNIGPNQTI